MEPTEATDRARALLDGHVEFVEREPWLEIVEERFGIGPEVFEPYYLVRPNRKGLNLVLRDHLSPERPKPEIIGMSFMRTRMRFPKLTTAAAMAFGHHATRNLVGLDQEQADCFLSRTRFELSSAQIESCTGTGYVLVRVREVMLGVGLYRAESHLLQSLLPKAWTLADDESAFES